MSQPRAPDEHGVARVDLARAPNDRRASIELSSTPKSLGVARAFVASTLEQWNCEDRDQVLALLVSELVSNAVRHAGGSVSLEAIRRKDQVMIRVRDSSPAAEVVRRSNPGRAGGHGLQIVHTLASRWGVERHATYKVVWFEAPICAGDSALH